PLNEANTTPHSSGRWWWWSRYGDMPGACAGTAPPTSGHHPDSNPELVPGPRRSVELRGGNVRPARPGTFGPCPCPSASRTLDVLRFGGGWMALRGEHLVGRSDELDALDRILDELDGATPGAVEVLGEPGIGKTRLLKELGARAEARGHLVLFGSA